MSHFSVFRFLLRKTGSHLATSFLTGVITWLETQRKCLRSSISFWSVCGSWWSSSPAPSSSTRGFSSPFTTMFTPASLGTSSATTSGGGFNWKCKRGLTLCGAICGQTEWTTSTLCTGPTTAKLKGCSGRLLPPTASNFGEGFTTALTEGCIRVSPWRIIWGPFRRRLSSWRSSWPHTNRKSQSWKSSRGGMFHTRQQPLIRVQQRGCSLLTSDWPTLRRITPQGPSPSAPASPEQQMVVISCRRTTATKTWTSVSPTAVTRNPGSQTWADDRRSARTVAGIQTQMSSLQPEQHVKHKTTGFPLILENTRTNIRWVAF